MKKSVLGLALILSSSLVWAQAVIVPSPIPALTNGCTLKWQTATTDWICSEASAASQPLTDSVGLIADDAVSTKILAFELSNITAATTRTWIIPDANITVPSTIASLAANTFTGLQTMNAGLASTSGTFSTTLGVTGALTGTSGAFSTTLDVTGFASFDDDIAVLSGNKVWLDSGVDTSIYQGVANNIYFETAGTVNHIFSGYGIALSSIVAGSGYIMDVWPTTATAANANVANAAAVKLVTSLRSAKQDFEPITTEQGRAVVMALAPFTYRSAVATDNQTRRWAGFGAEDVEAAEPTLATYDPNGQLLSVAYDRISAYMIPVMQDHEARIAAIEAQFKENQQ